MYSFVCIRIYGIEGFAGFLWDVLKNQVNPDAGTAQYTPLSVSGFTGLKDLQDSFGTY